MHAMYFTVDFWGKKPLDPLQLFRKSVLYKLFGDIFPTVTLQKTIEFSVWVENMTYKSGGGNCSSNGFQVRCSLWPHSCGQTLTT